MALSGKSEFVFQNSEGKTFNFYLNEKEEIQCISSNNLQQWVKKEDVFHKRCSSLDICLDSNDQFHIASYHYDRELYYLYNNKDQWKSILLTSLGKSEKVFYPRIKMINSNIHIFYDLQQFNQRDRCSLFHYTYDKKSMTWLKNNFCTIRFNRFVNPYRVLAYNKRIIVLYISVINNNEEVFLIEYDSTKDQWSKPQQLTNSCDQKLYMDALLDKEGTLHLTWCQYQLEKGLMVQYLKIDPQKVNLEDNKILALSQRFNCSFPQLILYNQQLYCMWVEFGHLSVSRSSDMGSSWTAPTAVKDSKINDFKRYRYSRNQPNNKLKIECDFLYGTHYPNIQFLGFGGDEEYDEISTN